MLRKSAYPMSPMPEALASLHAAACEVRSFSAAAELLKLTDPSIIGRVAAEDVCSSVSVPAHPCSRLDGYAVRAGDGAGLYPVVRLHRAGHVGPLSAAECALQSGQVAYITTGAPLPPGADAIVKVEDTEEASAQEAAAASAPAASAAASITAASPPAAAAVSWVRIKSTVPVGEGVRAAGSDVKPGQLLLRAGTVLRPLDIATCLSARVTALPVIPLPSVGIMSTGDEIRDPYNATASAAENQDDAVLDSNRPMLMAMAAATLAPAAVHDCGLVPDTQEVIRAALLAAVSKHHVLVTTGAVSMGDRDYVKPALEALCAGTGHSHSGAASSTTAGVSVSGRMLFGRLNMKPGKPTTAALLRVTRDTDAPGATPHHCLVLALPGNPVSAAVCFHMLVAPTLRFLCQAPASVSAASSAALWAGCLPPVVSVRTADALALDPERPEYHRAIVWWHSRNDSTDSSALASGGPGVPQGLGELVARSTGSQASSRLASFTAANALLWLPAQARVLPQGSIVPAFLLDKPYAEAALPAGITEIRSADAAAAVVVPSCGCGRSHSYGEPHAPAPANTARAYPPHVLHGTAVSTTAAPATSSTAGSAASTSVPVPVRVAVITVSDRTSRGDTVDTAGPAVFAHLSDRSKFPGLAVTAVQVQSGGISSTAVAAAAPATAVVPDDVPAIQAALRRWADSNDADLIITTGGTGFGPRDVTPEATAPLLHKAAPGLVHAMLATSLQHTPMAALSRYTAGVRGSSLIINLPGSPKAVRECLDALAKVLPHALALIRD